VHLGYTYVDVRPDLEVDEVGKWKGAINVPLVNSKRVYDASVNKKVGALQGQRAAGSSGTEELLFVGG
jgi:hypothetical protein